VPQNWASGVPTCWHYFAIHASGGEKLDGEWRSSMGGCRNTSSPFPCILLRRLAAMMDVSFREHIHSQLNFQTTAQIRKHLSAHPLPQNFRQHPQPLPVAIGRVTFLRRVDLSGRIMILGPKFSVGKRQTH
jgi:hypothetical protein